MNNNEALAYIDRLWNKYGALYSDEKNAEHEEEAELMQKYFRALSIAKDAIKALEQEPTLLSSGLEKNSKKLDCISRADAVRIASGYCHPSNVAKELAKLPSVTPQEPRWIPVSERMPEDGQFVLFCDIDDDSMVGYHVKGRPNTHFLQVGIFEDMKNVRAWMPLPKPYEPQGSEE